jgi:hypothetical protein
MLNWFKKKKREIVASELSQTKLHRIDYPAKIILAWVKAIEGDSNFLQWLNENGFPELAMTTKAIYLNENSRNWLQTNGYAHLLAMVNAAEGNESAQKWLMVHDFEILFHIAMAVEDDQESWKWLKLNGTQDLFLLASTIKVVKDRIEENHNDFHSFRKDS